LNYSDRYFNTNYNSQSDPQRKRYDPDLCSWCQSNKIETRYMGVQVCNECKFNKLDNESSGEKYDRYSSMGVSHEEAYASSYGDNE